MAKNNEGKLGVKTARTIFTILEALQENDGLSVSELATEVDMSRSTAHRHLTSLEQVGYVIRENDHYHIGLRFLHLGIYARDRYGIYWQARPKVDKLADQTDERVQLMVEEHGQGVQLYPKFGNQSVQTDAQPGQRVHLHTNAAGKAILAFLPREHVEEIIDELGCPRQTDNTITDPDALFDELNKIRDRGVAFNDGERIEGLRAVGAPVLDSDRNVVGSISISGPAGRFTDNWYHEELPKLLRGAVNEIELNLKY